MQSPSVGRIVHYVSYGTPGGEFTSECRAAVISEVPPVNLGAVTTVTVGLVVINPGGLFFHPLANGGCYYDESGTKGGTWHWPERT